MRLILTALTLLAGLFNLFLAVSFLLDPAGMGAQFGVSPNGALGQAVLRADFTAFFAVCGGCMVWGAWRRSGDLLLVPVALLGIAFVGRLITAVSYGVEPGFFVPMVAEAAQVVLLLAAWRVVPHHSIEELTD